MSANTTDTKSVPSLNRNAIIHPSLNSLMISHTFLTLLVPLVISLFHFSTLKSRRRPIFILNLTAIFLAFVVGILIDAFAIHTVLEPLNPWPPVFNIIIGFVSVWQSIIVDLTLLVRLVSVYSPRHLGLARFSLLIAMPVFLKLTRVANIILFTKVMVGAMNGPNASVTMQFVFATKPYLKIEWAAQMTDNAYASLAFLWKVRHRESKNKWIMTDPSRSTLAHHMRTLSRIALTNFVLPTMFSIAQFVCVYRNVNVMVLNQLILVNTMLATFGIAFATVWAGNISRRETRILDPNGDNTTSRLLAIFGVGTERAANQSSPVVISTSRSTVDLRDEVKA